MAGLFYYPAINAPRTVVYQALLYWDRLVTVAPPGPVEGFLDPLMRQVNDAGLYQRLEANGWPGPSDIEVSGTLRKLTRLLDSVPADELIPSNGPDVYVHSIKISPELYRELEHRGLALPGGEHFDRIRVSPATQLCLISIAARQIATRFRDPWGGSGCDDENALFPFTDSPVAHRLAHSPFPAAELPPGANPSFSERLANELDASGSVPCWNVQVGRLLPVPAQDVLIGDLIAFRERYADERRRLMSALDLLIHGLQYRYRHPQDVFRALRRELEEALSDLEAAGRAARITWIRRSLTVSIALAAGYASKQLFPDTDWVLGVIGAIAINVATNQSRPSPGEGVGDFSYLLRVQTALT